MIISRGMVYGKELDEYLWRQREKWGLIGFFVGGGVASIFWLIALGL